MNEKLRALILSYKKEISRMKKREILKKVVELNKNFTDFLFIMNQVKVKNLDVEFIKAIIDNFFAKEFSGQSLTSFYQTIKNQLLLKLYFINCMNRKELPARTWVAIYADVTDKDLAQILENLIVSMDYSMEHFVLLASMKNIDETVTKQALIELKKHDGSANFWIKAYERAPSGSVLEKHAEKMVKNNAEGRTFTSANELFIENYGRRVEHILLNVVAKKAETQKEIEDLLYRASEGSYAFKILSEKKEKLCEVE